MEFNVSQKDIENAYTLRLQFLTHEMKNRYNPQHSMYWPYTYIANLCEMAGLLGELDQAYHNEEINLLTFRAAKLLGIVITT